MPCHLFKLTTANSSQEALDLIASILESSTEYSMIGKDLDGNIVLWNEGARRIYGYEPEEVVGKANAVLLHAAAGVLAGKPGQILDAARRDGKWEGTLSRRRKNGENFVAHAVVTSRRDAGGQHVGFLVISKDISLETRLAVEHGQSEERLQGIVNAAMDAIITIDGGHRVVLFNRAAERMFGYASEDVLGDSIERFIPKRFRAAHGEHIRTFDRTGMTSRKMGALGALSGLRANGEEFPIEASISQLEIANEKLFTVILRDITERKQAEDLLRDSEARFAGIVNAATDAIITIDDQQRLVLFNRAAETMFGYASEDIVGEPIEKLIPQRFRASHGGHIRTFERTGMTSRKMGALGALSGVRANGEEFPIEASISQVEIAGKKLFTVILRDITERKRVEVALYEKNEELQTMSQQLWQATKLATMGELASSIAHELNNPLATVSLRVEDLLGSVPAGDATRRSLEIVDQETSRMGNLVNSLLQFSRRSARQVTTINVQDEIEGTLELIHFHLRNHNVKVERRFAAQLPDVLADRQQLRQLFLNLFTNASDAMAQGGTLTLKATESDGLVVIEVEDTGAGIKPEFLSRVMEPFFTTKPEGKGTGLGLAICRRIVDEQNGTLEISSTPGVGTTVRVSLPLVNGRAEPLGD